jgi:hypothetical protein
MNGFTNWQTYSIREQELDHVVQMTVAGEMDPMDHEQLRDYIVDLHESVGFTIDFAPAFAWELFHNAIYSEVNWRELAEWVSEAVKEEKNYANIHAI